MVRRNSIAKNTIYNIAYNLLNVIFPLVTIPLVSRILLSDGLGKINYARNIVSWFIIFAALGIPRYGVREIARNRFNQKNLDKCFSEIFVISTISTFVTSFAYIISIFTIPYLKNELLLYVVTGVQLFFNVFNVDWFYQGMEEYAYITKRSFCVKALSLISIVLFVRDKSDYIIYALIQSMAVVLNYLFNVVNLRKYIKFGLKHLNLKKHLKPIILLLSTTLAVSIYSLLDVTMVGLFCGDSAVGYYTNVHKIINTITVVSTSLAGVLLPQLVFFYTNNRTDDLKSLCNKVLKIILVITIPMAIGVFMLAPQMVRVLFGDDFLPAITTMKIFAPFIVINTLGNFYGTQLLMTFNKEKDLLFTVIVGALLNFILNFILIRYIQQNGAAIASVIEELVVMLIQRKIALKTLKLQTDFVDLFKIIAMNLFMLFALLFITNYPTGDLMVLISSIVVCALLYFTSGYIIREKAVLFLMDMVKKKI